MIYQDILKPMETCEEISFRGGTEMGTCKKKKMIIQFILTRVWALITFISTILNGISSRFIYLQFVLGAELCRPTYCDNLCMGPSPVVILIPFPRLKPTGFILLFIFL